MTIEQDENDGLVRKGLKGVTHAAKLGVAGAKQASDTITGRGVAEAVAEYEEVFSRVLVGVSNDVQRQSDRLDAVEDDVKSMATKAEAKQIAVEIERFAVKMEQQLSRTRMFAIASLAVGAVALVIALWIAI